MELECIIKTTEGAAVMLTREIPMEQGRERREAHMALNHLVVALRTLEALRDAPEKTGGAL